MDRTWLTVAVVALGCAPSRQAPNVEYVKTEEWQPSPQVKAMEDAPKPPSVAAPPATMTLEKHQPIPETTFRGPRRRRR